MKERSWVRLSQREQQELRRTITDIPCLLLSSPRGISDAKMSAASAAHRASHKGVPLAFGTDYPVEPVTPFRGLYAAVTRKSENGKREYFPEQRITMDQAIAAYTTGPAFAEFEEKEKGKLVAGMLADFVVLDRDVSAASPEKLLATKVMRTVAGGKMVYEAK
jgi:predicted amidohydrolase YtcJ